MAFHQILQKMLILWNNSWRTGLQPIWSPQIDLPLGVFTLVTSGWVVSEFLMRVSKFNMTPNGERQTIGPDRSHIFEAGVNFLMRASPTWKPLLEKTLTCIVYPLIHSTRFAPLLKIIRCAWQSRHVTQQTHQKECYPVCLLNETDIPHWKLVYWKDITPGRRGRSAPHYNQSYCATQPAGHCTDTNAKHLQSCDQETEPASGTHPKGSAPGSGCWCHLLQTGHLGLGSGPHHVGDTPHHQPAPSPPTPPPHSHRTQLWWHLRIGHWSQWACDQGCSRWRSTSPYLTWLIWWGWILLWSSSAAGWLLGPSHSEQQTSPLPPPDTSHQDYGTHHERQQKPHHSQHQSTWSLHSAYN